MALGALINQVALHFTRKSGNTKQARKSYRVTWEPAFARLERCCPTPGKSNRDKGENLADAKFEIKAGSVSFVGEGTENWLAEQLDKLPRN